MDVINYYSPKVSSGDTWLVKIRVAADYLGCINSSRRKIEVAAVENADPFFVDRAH